MKLDLLKPYFNALLSIITIIIYPSSYIYFINIEQSKFTDLFGVVGLLLLNAALIFIILFLFIRDFHNAGLFTNIYLLFCLNFVLIEKGLLAIFPILNYWHIILIIIIVVVNLGILLQRFLTRKNALIINSTFLFIFGGLIIINFLSVTPKIYKLIIEKPITTTFSMEISNSGNDSNVYYFIFDEYGGLDCLERYCQYDNSHFYESLEQLGFNVSKNSKNSTIQSTVEIPNLLNLELINNEHMTHQVMVQALESPYLFRLFRENGYSLNIFHSNIPYMPINTSMSDYYYEFKPRVVEDTLQFYILQKTVFYPLIQHSSGKKISEINNMFNYAKDSWKLQSNNLFTFGYFYFPHLPWFVDEFGNDINIADTFNWRNPDAYLGQLKYCNVKIIEMVKEITENDPLSIIILQSDHGYRRPVFLEKEFGETIENMDEELEYMLSILNAVYFKGENLEIESLSGINTLRTVLNHHFGVEMDLIETVLDQ